MADYRDSRLRTGPGNVVLARVITAQAIDLGNALCASTGFVAPPASLVAAAVLATAQTNAATLFHGVAAQGKDAGTAYPGHGGGGANLLRTLIGGDTDVFEFNCFATTFAVGDLVGLAHATAGSTLDPTKVVGVASAGLAIGRIAEAKTEASSTTCRIRLWSETMLGGVQT